jgi:ubiquinone/menaquinone biosynthesis C-methylase UbiE
MEAPGALRWNAVFTRSAAFYDAVYAGKDYLGEAERVSSLIRTHGRASGNTLLDVACGTGGHLAYLKHHYAAEGLDIDPNLLAIARARHPELRFHLGDMVDFDLGRTFDAVVCLFSAIGYVVTVERLHAAIAAMARHLRPGGVLLVEPWITREGYTVGTVHALYVDRPTLKIARINVSAVQGRVSILEFHYLVGTPAGVDQFTERHELGLFTEDEYCDAAVAAGLVTSFDEHGLTGRGLLIGVRPFTDI